MNIYAVIAIIIVLCAAAIGVMALLLWNGPKKSVSLKDYTAHCGSMRTEVSALSRSEAFQKAKRLYPKDFRTYHQLPRKICVRRKKRDERYGGHNY